MSDATRLAEAMLGLDGFRVLAVEETAVEVIIRIETTKTLVGCPVCGVQAVAHDRMVVGQDVLLDAISVLEHFDVQIVAVLVAGTDDLVLRALGERESPAVAGVIVHAANDVVARAEALRIHYLVGLLELRPDEIRVGLRGCEGRRGPDAEHRGGEKGGSREKSMSH